MKRLAHTFLEVLKNGLLSLCVPKVALLCPNHTSLKAFFTFGTPKGKNGSRLTAHCLLLTAHCLLLPVHASLSQSLPQWEHRALQYTRYNINKDFFSMNQPLQVGSEGELLFSPEENELYALHNTEVELLLKEKMQAYSIKNTSSWTTISMVFPRLSIREILIKTLNNKK